MPELPEILRIGNQMHQTITGKVLEEVEVHQPKCLNMSEAEFRVILGKRVLRVEPLGKWVFVHLEGDLVLLLCLGMGGELRYREPGEELPPGAKIQARFRFTDGSGFTLSFFWFGYIHLATAANLADHPAGQLGPSPLDDAFTLEALAKVLSSTGRNVKSVITDQRVVAGIGNAYCHDILFLAGIHPLVPSKKLSPEQVAKLHWAMREGLTRVINHDGLRYETDFFGATGRYDGFLVGYQEGKQCPECGTAIAKIKTGSTSTFICERCQPAP
ncbi:MAG TPA: DNA-formamidopyrimidine glycosylase family protein [Armatimonadota bacterium]|jgi:formamidopyrimidine-DNA glycosylase